MRKILSILTLGVDWVLGLQYFMLFSHDLTFLVLVPLTVLWRSRKDYYELWSSRQPVVRMSEGKQYKCEICDVAGNTV